MNTDTIAPYESQLRVRDGFVHLLRAEWTKFRTVRGWVIGTVAAVLVTVLVGLLGPAGSQVVCQGADGSACPGDTAPPLGPDGEAVTDSSYFVHQPLAGDGSITARVTSLTGQSDEGPNDTHDGAEPWAKGGIMIKEGTTQGSTYAAMMVTGSHGVRMQYDYTHDLAGTPGAVSAASPRWLRLTRSGATVTGADSVDGSHWSVLGSATLPGLSSTAQVGMFATSPMHVELTGSFNGDTTSGSATATAVVDDVSLTGRRATGTWTGDDIGGLMGKDAAFKQADGRFTLSGSGDVAPSEPSPTVWGRKLEDGLVGTFAGLIVMIVVASMFVTSEYRRGLIRTTLAANPRRGRVLAAKAVVVGAVAFVAGVVAAVVAVPVVAALEQAKGLHVYPVAWPTELRLVVGTGALLAVAAVFALGIGVVLRRGAGAVTTVIVVIALPHILGVTGVLPPAAAQWLLRVTPAAGFAVQQSMPEYPQLTMDYTPDGGYYPLPPWVGFAVLCAYAALAMGFATFLLRRRDV
jgi:ABC-type transport system involved in multi-copper enzyme maturation permease subunit